MAKPRNQCIVCFEIEFHKFAKIVVVQVMGSVEDERTFATLIFIKTHLRNNLRNHMGSVVRMLCQPFWRLDNFPFDEAYAHG